jgi:hypothetical protein
MTPITFEKLIETLDSLEYSTGIYCNKKAWKQRPLQELLYLASKDERSEPDFDSQIAERGLRRFLHLQMLQDVVVVERRTRPSATIEDIVAATNHYDELDAFRP